MVSVTAGGVIGWDNVEDNNSSPSIIGQIAVSPNDRAAVYVNGIYGPEQTCFPNPGAFQSGCNRNKRGVVDVVGNFKLTDDLGFILNFDWASEDEASVGEPGPSLHLGRRVGHPHLPDHRSLQHRGARRVVQRRAGLAHGRAAGPLGA